MFLSHAQSLLQAMRCQTSPDYPSMKYGNPDKHLDLDFAENGGFLYVLSSTLLFWQGDRDSCIAVNMIRQNSESPPLTGSLHLLWPLFQSLCLSQFIETLSCAVQGRPIMTETGMSIFEHSLAFAEAEAMVSNQLGLGPFGLTKGSVIKKATEADGSLDPASIIASSVLFEKLNTPPEVLLMGLISCLNSLSSHVLGVLGMQGRFRLINTGIWGLCFMSSFIWGFFSFPSEANADAIILRFPTVCIVGFIPHLLILAGICMCACIYFLALVLSALSPPIGLPPPRGLVERFKMAHENLQANAQLSSLRINMHEDFYTALLKVGFTTLTVASEAVYLNEGRRIGIGKWTWLEEDRLKEIEQTRQSLSADNPDGLVATGITLAEGQDSQSPLGPRKWKSGYARERTTKSLKAGRRSGNPRMRADGVGALQRGGRYIMAWEFFTGIFWLIVGWLALGLVKTFDKVGIVRRPQWMRNVSTSTKVTKRREKAAQITKPDYLEFWLLSDDGVLSLPPNDNVDVEVETKKRLRIVSESWGDEEEQKLDSTLYGWWTHGGWWGERDESGNYHPSEKDDDVTSEVSMSTNLSEDDWESDRGQDGDTTPTQREPKFISRESSPVMDLTLDPSQLARLLNPKDLEERQEARMLAHHLASDSVVTRSQYRHAQDFEKAHVLTSTRYRPIGFTPSLPNGKLTPNEEAEILEHLLLTRRSQYAASSVAAESDGSSSSTWKDGAEGLGAGGPQCVVCQSSPRTILAWPCRCLSICEECRVSLAMNNFGTCVCCRQEVVGFSRLFVP